MKKIRSKSVLKYKYKLANKYDKLKINNLSNKIYIVFYIKRTFKLIILTRCHKNRPVHHSIHVLSFIMSVKIAVISSFGNWVGDTLLFPLDTISTRLKARKTNDIGAIRFIIESIKN